jgi:GntR family transcriptional repressor for pyruvate dehydrogenase complex
MTSTKGPRWEIAADLRRRIMEEDIPRGSRLPTERDLAEELGVTRTTLREVLRILRKEGYLKTVPGRSGGTMVTDLALPEELWYERMRQNPDELDEVFDYRVAIETRCAYLAATRRNEEDLAAMEQSIAMLQGGDEVTCSSFREADSMFHSAVAKASGNKRLAAETHNTRGEIFFPFDFLPHPVYVVPALEGHVAVLNAVRHMDGRAAATAMEVHLEQTRVELRTIIIMTNGRESHGRR